MASLMDFARMGYGQPTKRKVGPDGMPVASSPASVTSAPGFNQTGQNGLGNANLGNPPVASPPPVSDRPAPISSGYGSNAGGTYSADPATGQGDWRGELRPTNTGGYARPPAAAPGADGGAPAVTPYNAGDPLPQWAQDKIAAGMAARNLSWNSNPAMLNSPGSIEAAQAKAQQRLTDRMTRRVSQNGIADPHQRLLAGIRADATR